MSIEGQDNRRIVQSPEIRMRGPRVLQEIESSILMHGLILYDMFRNGNFLGRTIVDTDYAKRTVSLRNFKGDNK